MDLQCHLDNMANNGYTVIGHVYSEAAVSAMISMIESADVNTDTFRKTDELYAIRQFIKGVPGVIQLIFTNELKQIIADLFSSEYFVVKSIYFDKPEASNWFVAWHQDLTISVDKRLDLPGYGPWTVKQDQFAVQPPLNILKDNFTVRIHLDDTDKANGALKVVPGSQAQGVQQLDAIDQVADRTVFCNVPAGGIMIMRPLLMHASNRSSGTKRRRVIHIEFSRSQLADGLNWSEKVLV
jgi:ectoine hydroxylase-related dioxygenase (phytanoyl-CoA dioxygenase family)